MLVYIFYHKGLVKYVGVMLIGKMEVLTDQETKNMIWKKEIPYSIKTVKRIQIIVF